MARIKRYLLSLLIFGLTGAACVGQVPSVRARWIRLASDSVRVEYALPKVSAVRPVVIVLSDRYGLQDNVRATLRVLATLGFRAYALPLHSAPEQPFNVLPEAAIDSSDVPLVTALAVELINERGCDGRVMLLGFDVGANIAMEVIARFPFYKGAVLFYPTGGAAALRRLLDAQCRFLLNTAQFDPDCSLSDVNAMRELCMERGKRMHVFYYKEARRFFFNPQHPDHHKVNTNTAWNQINKFFRNQ